MRQRALEGGSLGLRSLEERAALGEGRLEIDSAPGRGTTLVLTLPAARPAAPDTPAGTTPPAATMRQ
jgi:signal transduction histidine kinase